MKKIGSSVFIGLMFLCGCTNQPTNEASINPSSDEQDCCDNDSVKKELICSLTTPELQERQKTVLTELRKTVLEKKELNNGFSFRFNGTDSSINMLTNFIKSERQCCAFLTFNLKIEDVNSSVWLTITGPEGSKDFVAVEMKL